MPKKSLITYELVKPELERLFAEKPAKMPSQKELCKMFKTSANKIAPIIKQFKAEKNLTNHWHNAAETTETRLRNKIAELKKENYHLKIYKELIKAITVDVGNDFLEVDFEKANFPADAKLKDVFNITNLITQLRIAESQNKAENETDENTEKS